MKEIEALAAEFCQEARITVQLSYNMPPGYEMAYGTYDVTCNTLCLNRKLLRDAPEHEVLFYVFHELRHALQYLCPDRFDEQIRQSRYYVVLYNGVCYKLTGDVWKETVIDGTEDWFSRAYMSLPYELDANRFAYEKVRQICGDTAALRELYRFWTPEEKMDFGELRALFFCIDYRTAKGI